jgi:hypothetical protein
MVAMHDTAHTVYTCKTYMDTHLQYTYTVHRTYIHTHTVYTHTNEYIAQLNSSLGSLKRQPQTQLYSQVADYRS